jgi:GNAT superfamily N-acetyltransferase
MEFKIEEYNPKEVSEEFWDRLHEYETAYDKFHNPNDPPPNKEALIQRQKADRSHCYYMHCIALTSEDKIVGNCWFWAPSETSPEYEQNKHICWAGVYVLPDYCRQGIGTFLLEKVVKKAQAHDRTTIQTGTNHESGRAFLKKYGATFTIAGAENRLEMEDVDWDLMQSWVDEGKKRNEGVILESFIDCPEEILEEFCEMFSEAVNMAPQGESEFRTNIDGNLRRVYEKQNKEEGWIHQTLISRENDGRISGMTEIYYDPREGYKLRQELTGVRPEFRGRGIGKWLKAHNILYIRDTFPEVTRIITGNAEVNAPMLSINNRMGYKKYKAGEGYKFKLEDLVKKLDLK